MPADKFAVPTEAGLLAGLDLTALRPVPSGDDRAPRDARVPAPHPRDDRGAKRGRAAQNPGGKRSYAFRRS